MERKIETVVELSTKFFYYSTTNEDGASTQRYGAAERKELGVNGYQIYTNLKDASVYTQAVHPR